MPEALEDLKPGSAQFYRRRFESSVMGNHMLMPPAVIAQQMMHPEAPPTHPTGPNTNFQYPTPMPYRYREEALSSHNERLQTAKAPHPIYQTSADEIGKLGMQVTDLPMRWYGLEGAFTAQWNSALPKTRVATGLNTGLDRSKNHHEYDQGWRGNLGLTDCAPHARDTECSSLPAHAPRSPRSPLAHLSRAADNIPNREYSTHVVRATRKTPHGL